MDRSAEWNVISSSTAEYLTVWKVQRKMHGRTQNGYFKIPDKTSYKHIGPLLANELVCNRLARVVGLPVAETLIATIHGKTGVLSIAKSNCKLMNWSHFVKQHRKPLEVIVDPSRLYKTFVFDTWICNVDRNGQNIIVYPQGRKYNFYLIDHELALLGALRYENKPWQSVYWDNIVRYTRGYHPALLRYGKNYRRLTRFIQEIHNISPNTIHAIINRIPSRLLSQRDKTLMKRILLHRQHRLAQIIYSIS